MNPDDTADEERAQQLAEAKEVAREKAARLSVRRWNEKNRGVTFTTDIRNIRSQLVFLGLLIVFMIGLHQPYLKLPFHWDELGQFVPSALDLWRDGAWITHTALPNIHPPGLSVILALVWKVFGYSIMTTRLAMLVVAAVGVWLAFLLTIRLARGTPGAPAFAAAALLVAAPMFYMQSMMALLDVPAMTFTLLALLLFLDEKYVWCAATCTLLVLVKETAITTPMVFGAWLLFRERKVRNALYFFAPAIALAVWLIVLHRATGSWFGNQEFAQSNINDSLSPQHLAYSISRRLFTLFLADGHWIGSIALYVGWRRLRGKDWTLALYVATAQVLLVTILGGAVLNRYLLPALPIFYAAVTVAATAYPSHWRGLSHGAMIVFLFAGWFINPPFPFPLEDNLAVVDFVSLQASAAEYLESFASNRRIAAVWPFSVAVVEPAYGYVTKPLLMTQVDGQHAKDFAKLDLDGPGDQYGRKIDILVVYSRGGYPPQMLLNIDIWRRVIETLNDLHPTASREDIEQLGFTRLNRFDRGGQWIEIYYRGRPQRVEAGNELTR